MRANTVMPLALTSASSRFIVCSGSKSLATTINPSAGIFGLDDWGAFLSIANHWLLRSRRARRTFLREISKGAGPRRTIRALAFGGVVLLLGAPCRLGRRRIKERAMRTWLT